MGRCVQLSVFTAASTEGERAAGILNRKDDEEANGGKVGGGKVRRQDGVEAQAFIKPN